LPYADPAKNEACKRVYEARQKATNREAFNRRRTESALRYQKRHPERVKEANRKYKLKHPDYVMVWQAKDRARRSGLPFNLQLGDIVIPSHCPVLGIPLCHATPGSKKWADGSPSLDRIKPELGYVKGNIRVISWRANNLKRDGTLAEFECIVAYLRDEL
jgi:hypothetical protein